MTNPPTVPPYHHAPHSAAPPKLQSPGLPSQALQQGQRVSLLCSVTDGDEPILISWQKDGAPLVSSSPDLDVTSIEHDSILRISSLEARHAGNYSCRADNAAGSALVHSAIRVMGMSPHL